MSPSPAEPSRPASAVPLWLAGLALALLFAAALRYHRELVAFPYPLDSAEPAESFIARGVAAGVDPGALKSQPLYCEGYGSVYLFVTSELCRHGIACDLPGQRALCALFIAGAVLLIVAVCRRLALPWLECGAAGLWAYELLLVNVTPISRPGALGVLLWLAGLAVSFLLDYSAPSLVAAALLFSLATFTKLYFLCGAGYLGAWLLLRRRDRLPYLLAGLAVFLPLLAFLTLRWLPYFFDEAVLLHAGAHSEKYMLWQLGHLLAFQTLGLALAAALAPFVPAERSSRPGGGVWALYGLFGLLLFVGLMGGDTGGRFTYFLQLAALPFVPYAAQVFHRAARARALGLCLLLAAAAWTANAAILPDFRPGGPAELAWRAADRLLDRARHPFADADLDCSLQARGLPVHDTGMVRWFASVAAPPASLAGFFPDTPELRLRYEAWLGSSRMALADPATDLAILSAGSPLHFPDLLRQYRLSSTVLVPYPQTGGSQLLEVYERRAVGGGPAWAGIPAQALPSVARSSTKR